MSGETTKPNGSRELKIKESEDIEKKMRESGYNCSVNYMEAQFSVEKVQSKGNSDAATSGSDGNTAGNHTIVGENGSVSFVQKIPAIVEGPAAPLKDAKDKKKSPSKEDKDTRDDKNLEDI